MCKSCGNYAHGGELGQTPTKNMTPENERESMLQMLESRLNNLHDSYLKKQGDNGTFPDFEQRIKELEGKANEIQTMADGGVVSPNAVVPGMYTPDEAKKKEAPGYDEGGDPSDDGMSPILKAADFAISPFGAAGDALLPYAEKAAPTLGRVENMVLGRNAGPSLPPGGPQPVDTSSIPGPVPDMAMPPSAPQAPSGPPVGAPPSAGMANSPAMASSMNDFFSQQSGLQDQFSPQKEAAAQQALLAKENGFPNRLAEGLAGFGDSLVSLAGGKGNAADMIKNRELNNQVNGVNKIGELRQAQQGATGAKLGLQEANPNSPLSMNEQKSVEMALGLKPGTLANIPSSMLAKVMESNATMQEKAMQIQLMAHQYSLENQEKMMALGLSAQGQRLGAAKDVAGQTLGDTITSIFNPTKAAAIRQEENIAGLPDSGGPAVAPGWKYVGKRGQ